MKRLVAIVLCLILLVCMCGCVDSNRINEFKQEMTIVTMPSPPKCKTTDNVNVINEVLSLFKEIKKTPLGDKINGGWSVMVKLNVDGNTFNYTLGDKIFTDSDGTQYSVDGTDTINRIREIYTQLDAPEKDYP